MTLHDAQKIVLKSIANEINSGYFAIYDQLQSGLVLAGSANLVKTAVDDLESVMSYIKVEATRIERARVSEVANELEGIWKEGSNEI